MPPKTRTKTINWFTPEEQKELERRGFLVKKNIWIKDNLRHVGFIIEMLLLATLWLLLFVYMPFAHFFWANSLITVTSIISWFFMVNFIYEFIQSGYSFFFPEGKISFWDLNKKSSWIIGFSIYSFREKLNSLLWLEQTRPLIFTLFVSLGTLCAAFFGVEVFLKWVIIAILLMWGFIGMLFLFRWLYQSFHPLYAFWNLWSKIQSLTPRISEESKKIEKEFSRDMNFRTLSDSFDTLAKDFNTIIEYVIRLEIIEKKANKWNLFDSNKYINSLREDIRNPLISLRSFLQKKKTELQSSQEEMKKVKVRIGWNGETENLDLSSKRTEPLIQELTENIEKLDRMIEKF